jgi:Domain of unknown function (DUF397)
MRSIKISLPRLPDKNDAYYESHGVTSADIANASWRKSSASGYNGNCVEVSRLRGGGHVAVRDTKDMETGPILVFTQAEWNAFLSAAKNGEFDLT